MTAFSITPGSRRGAETMEHAAIKGRSLWDDARRRLLRNRAAVASMIRVVELMGTLRKVGCKFSLDDFGAGMASFGYLKNLPVDFVKIDGSFIRNLQTDPISASIVRAVTDIGHQLGLKVVAEWVGDTQTLELLRSAHVDYAQGFHVHRPELAHFMR